METIQLVVFDLAGTTVKDNGEVPAAFARALTEYGIDFSDDQFSSVRGASKREALLRLLPESSRKASLTETIYASFCRHLKNTYRQNGVKPIDGASEIFEWLHEKGIRIALNTGFDRQITSLLLQTLNWNEQIIDAVVCSDEVTAGRPSPDMIFRAMERTRIASASQVATVGDTILDLMAGHSAGVRWNIAVLTGAHDHQTLERSPHTYILESVKDLRNLPFATLL